jgi:phosphohistidine phosphatase
MKRLILMRHAKSDWSDLTLADHARRLNARGKRSASAMGRWLKDHQMMPDHVLCSDAARTVQTLTVLDLGDVPTTLTPKLYLAGAETMAELLRGRSEDCTLMVCHNPGAGMLARMLLGDAPDHPDFDLFPTCATLVADFDIPDWRALRNGTGTVAHFIVPRQLTD